MSATYASIANLANVDGIPYAAALTMPTSEGDLFSGGQGPDPIQITWVASFLAVIKLTYTGGSTGNSGTYVVAQTSIDGGTTWIDLAWFKDVTTGTVATPLVFVLSGGGAAVNNSVTNTRASGSAPASNDSVNLPLGGLLRFVGKTTLTGGTAPTAIVSINYKLLGLN